MPWVEALRQTGQKTVQKSRNRYVGVSVEQCIGISVCHDTVSNHHGRGPSSAVQFDKEMRREQGVVQGIVLVPQVVGPDPSMRAR